MTNNNQSLALNGQWIHILKIEIVKEKEILEYIYFSENARGRNFKGKCKEEKDKEKNIIFFSCLVIHEILSKKSIYFSLSTNLTLLFHICTHSNQPFFFFFMGKR